MSMSWSAEQREWLQALGYDPLVRAPQAPVPGNAPAADLRGVDAPVASMPVPDVERASAAMAHAGNDIDPLLRAMLRAARAEALEEVHAIAGDVARLRADPAAKRAAWPQLRTLRARRRQ